MRQRLTGEVVTSLFLELSPSVCLVIYTSIYLSVAINLLLGVFVSLTVSQTFPSSFSIDSCRGKEINCLEKTVSFDIPIENGNNAIAAK